MTHTELCQVGARWLLNNKNYHYRCNYVVVEFVALCEESPDILGFKGGSQTLLVETKMSRSDFFADRKKRHRNDGSGVGEFRYYLCPEGLINEEELPSGWGLLYCYPDGKIKPVKESSQFKDRDMINETTIMYSIIRRLAGKRQVFNWKEKP